MCYSPSILEQIQLSGRSYDFWREATLDDKTAKLAKSSKMTVHRNRCRGPDLQAISIPQLLRGKSAVQSPEIVQRTI
jgi:hypothetical protein